MGVVSFGSAWAAEWYHALESASRTQRGSHGANHLGWSNRPSGALISVWPSDRIPANPFRTEPACAVSAEGRVLEESLIETWAS